MSVRIGPPDVEATLIAYLAPLLSPVKVAGQMQGNPHGAFLEVRATGGTRRDVAVFEPQVTLIAWGASPDDDAAAWQLAADVAAHMDAAERAGWIGSVSCTSVLVVSTPYKDPDPVTGRARYTATYRPQLRGTIRTD